MARLSTEAKLGLFVLLGIILLAYMSLRVGRWDWVTGGGYKITAVFDTVSGLKKDVPVEIAGVEVGRVDDIHLKDSKAQVTMRIKGDVLIPKDSTAVIQTKGVLGEKYIEIIPPQREAVVEPSTGQTRLSGRYVPEGGEIKQTRSAADLDKLLRTLGEVGDDVKTVTRSLSNVLGGPQGEQSLRDIVDNIRLLTENLSEAVVQNRAQFNEMITNFASFSKDISQMTAENRGRINDTLANLKDASAQLERAMGAVERLAENIEQGKGVMGKLVSDEKTADDLESTLASLKDVTTKINEGKGTLGKLVNDDTTVNQLNKTLESFSNYQQKFEDFKTYIGFRGEYLTRQGDGKGYLSLKIQPKKDKYYLIEILRDPGFTQTTRSVTTTTTDGSTKTSTRTENEQDQLKFSVEIAKRFYNLVLRGGIIESSAGVGADYYLFDDRLRLTAEAFDFDRQDFGTHYKAYANLNFLKYFFITAGYDDIGSSKRRTPLVGGGLYFLDDDIKYLLTGSPIAISTK